MAVDYVSLQIQFGALLQIMRKREALLEHILRASNVNFDRRRLTQTNGFGGDDTEEARALGRQLTHLDGSAGPSVSGVWSSYRSLIEDPNDFFGIIIADVPASADDRAAGAIEYEYETVDGAVSISNRVGVLAALRADMLAQGEFVLANGITFGALVVTTGNLGILALTSITGLSHALTGTLVLEVTGESVDAPTLSVSNELTDRLPDNQTIVDADNDLTAEKSLEDGPTGITVTLTRPGLAAPVETGDDGAMFSATSIASPAEADMNGGVLQVKVTRQATTPIWLIEFFNSSARTTKVGTVTTDTVLGTFAIDITLTNGTRFQSTFDRVAANVKLPATGNTDNDISFDIQTPRLGDRWTITVTNDEVGNYSTKIAKAWRTSLPVAGSSQWTEANAASIAVT